MSKADNFTHIHRGLETDRAWCGVRVARPLGSKVKIYPIRDRGVATCPVCNMRGHERTWPVEYIVHCREADKDMPVDSEALGRHTAKALSRANPGMTFDVLDNGTPDKNGRPVFLCIASYRDGVSAL